MQESMLVVAVLMTIGMLLAVFLLIAIPAIITTWQLFTKAGQPGWACIVPVYNSVIMARIGKKPEWMGWAAGIGYILLSILNGANDSSSFTAATLLTGFLGFIIWIGSLILAIIILIGFVKQFRHVRGESTAGFWVCYFLLPIAAVFMVKNLVHVGTMPSGSQAPGQPGQQPAPPYVPPVAQ